MVTICCVLEGAQTSPAALARGLADTLTQMGVAERVLTTASTDEQVEVSLTLKGMPIPAIESVLARVHNAWPAVASRVPGLPPMLEAAAVSITATLREPEPEPEHEPRLMLEAVDAWSGPGSPDTGRLRPAGPDPPWPAGASPCRRRVLAEVGLDPGHDA